MVALRLSEHNSRQWLRNKNGHLLHVDNIINDKIQNTTWNTTP